MPQLIFVLGIFVCSLQNSLSMPTTTPVEGINFEYIPPPPKSDSELFTAILEPTSGTNVTVQQFMYHLKHSTYASAFMTEIFTLGIGTHLFTDDLMDNPSEEERRIAAIINKLWSTLTGMQAVNRIVLKISNETAHRYLRAEDQIGTIKYAFSKLKDAALADPTLSKAYVEEEKELELFVLPPLIFVNINLTKFGSIDRLLIKKVWPDPRSFELIAHARFSQHLETKLINTTGEDYDNVLLAHLLVEAAFLPDLKESAQKAYDEAIMETVKNSFDFLRLTKFYDQFDVALFKSLNLAIKGYPKLDEKLMEMKSTYPSTPPPEVE